jgi:hypothetical protein
MDQYMFLFPLKGYFDASLDFFKTFSMEGHTPGEIFDIVDARYRKGYEVNWLVFGKENDLTKPDTDEIPEYARIQKQDRVISAGVSLEKFLSENIYFDSNYVLDQLPPHKKLVTGGFHLWDCVDRVSRMSYERGVDTKVDEDTTELFFAGHQHGYIPVVRNKPRILRELLPEDALYEIAKENRKDRPWLIQL